MAREFFILALFAAVAPHAETTQANPIRKVVTMLQMMQKKVEAEGEKEQKMFDAYMCWCKTGGGDLEKSIADGTAKVGELGSAIEEGEAELAQLAEDLTAHKADRASAETAMKEATAIREKEAAAYAAATDETKANIAAIEKAVAALEAGMAGGFLQTGAAQILRNMFAKQKNVDQGIMAFLSGSQEYAPQSGQITGILKQMHDEMSADVADATAAEESAIKAYDGLMAAKKKEIAALTKMIEEKLERQAALKVSVAEMKADVGDTAEAIEADKKFLANLEVNCAAKKKEWAVRSATRAEELVALADTIKVLNDDDALELFKKTLPSASASFVQVAVTANALKARALAMIQAPHSARLDFIALALRGKKIGFEGVIKMIDEMVATLAQEQKDDDDKKEYCAAEFDSSDDKKKALERSIADLETAIAKTEEAIAGLKDSIAALEAGIKALDKQVAEATEQRKQEHVDFNDLIAQDSAAKEVLKFAKNRLNKFYNPKLYKAPPKRELSEEDRITVNNGGTLAPTAAPGGIAGTGIEALAQVSLHAQGQVAPPPPPETFDAYSKKSGESAGVIQMIDMLVKDLDKEMTEAEAEEKDAQADYEQMMKDSADKRAADSKSLEEQEAAKADAEASLQQHGADKKADEKELGATLQYIHSLHNECDWLLQYFDARKEARAGEVDALGKAKAVLSGADYSFIQTRSAKSLRGSVKAAPEDDLAKEMTHDLEMNFNKIAPFGKEDTAKELQDHAAKTQDTLVDAVENAEVAEIKRAVFRALTRLRAATIKEFDTIARLETQAIDAYNDAHHYRAENPLAHLHEDEAPVETDKLKSFH
jgi:septal ring factor EnvC (AmiA/AmiB activator)